MVRDALAGVDRWLVDTDQALGGRDLVLVAISSRQAPRIIGYGAPAAVQQSFGSFVHRRLALQDDGPREARGLHGQPLEAKDRRTGHVYCSAWSHPSGATT